MITEESSWQMEFHVEQVWQQRIVVNGCKNCANNAQNPTWLAQGWATPFEQHCRPALGKGCDRFAKLIRMVSVTSCAIQSRHKSTGIRLIPQVKRAHVWAQFSLPGRGLCSGYPSHLRTEQKSYLKWDNNLPKRWDAVMEKQGDYIEGL
jgi:hypothetical protein